jgi:hypothetical protein
VDDVCSQNFQVGIEEGMAPVCHVKYVKKPVPCTEMDDHSIFAGAGSLSTDLADVIAGKVKSGDECRRHRCGEQLPRVYGKGGIA